MLQDIFFSELRYQDCCTYSLVKSEAGCVGLTWAIPKWQHAWCWHKSEMTLLEPVQVWGKSELWNSDFKILPKVLPAECPWHGYCLLVLNQKACLHERFVSNAAALTQTEVRFLGTGLKSCAKIEFCLKFIIKCISLHLVGKWILLGFPNS